MNQKKIFALDTEKVGVTQLAVQVILAACERENRTLGTFSELLHGKYFRSLCDSEAKKHVAENLQKVPSLFCSFAVFCYWVIKFIVPY